MEGMVCLSRRWGWSVLDRLVKMDRDSSKARKR